MTQEEWLTYSDPDVWRRVTHPMLTFLESVDRATERKLRLFAVACCRIMFRKIEVPIRYEQLVDVAERYAEGAASLAELQIKWRYPESASEQEAWQLISKAAHHACLNTIETDNHVVMAEAASSNAAWAATQPGPVMLDDNGVSEARLAAAHAAHCDIIRDIFGNPFRAITLHSACRMLTAVSLARATLNERHLCGGELDPHRLFVLADALEEAGAPGELVAHLRGPGPHLRGCWAVDLSLGLT